MTRCFVSIFLLCLFVVPRGFANKNVVIAISSSPSKLNPFFSTDANSQNINRLVHASLIDFDRKMQPVCVLCQSFSDKVVNGKHIISFKLKKDLKFHDGNELTSNSVRYAWELFSKDMNIKSIFRFAFGNIKDVRIKDKYQFDLIYDSFAWDNLPNLVLFKILKIKNYKEGVLTKAKVELEDIVGAGPYKYTFISKLDVKLTPAFDDHLTSLSFKVVKDETTLALKLINKEVDLSLAQLSPRKYFYLKSQGENLKFFEEAGSNYVYIGINHRKEHLSNLKVRKSLSLLLPKKDLAKYKMRGLVDLSNGLFSSAFTNLKSSMPIYSYDPTRSMKLLLEAGYSKNENGFWQKNGKLLEVNWRISNNKSTVELVNTIKDEFVRNGIKSNVLVQEWGTFMRAVKKGQFDLFVSQWVGFTGPEMLKMIFHTDSFPPKGANRGFYSNAEFDKVLDMGLAKTSLSTGVNFFKKAMDIATKDLAYIHLWHPKVAWVGAKCIKYLNPFSNGSFLTFLDMQADCE